MTRDGVLLGAIVLSALALITVRNDERLLFQQWATLQATAQEHDVEWSKLLLEQGAFAAHARIGKIARQNLAMGMPNSKQIVLVYGDRVVAPHVAP